MNINILYTHIASLIWRHMIISSVLIDLLLIQFLLALDSMVFNLVWHWNVTASIYLVSLILKCSFLLYFKA
nr:hypothetical protein Itr_chr12CG20260 [Ipomoea trifida]